MKNKKIIVISGRPWSQSNRGMDILIEALLKKGKNIKLIVFPNVLHRKIKNRLKNKEERVFNGILKTEYPITLYPYYHEKYMKNFGKYLFNFVKFTTCFTFPKIDFLEAKIVILESGYPVLLANKIPNYIPIIYRQSDPIELTSSKNKQFAFVERSLIKKSIKTIVVRSSILNYYKNKYYELSKKMILSVNGFNIPDKYKENENIESPYSRNSKNAVYLGYSPLDFETMNLLGKEVGEVNFHVIGACMNNEEIKKLSVYDNIIFYGNQTPSEYIKYIKYADMAFIPYKRGWKATDWIGLNSKYLLFMYYNLPIISYKVGAISEFDGLPVRFCNKPIDFIKEIKDCCKKGKSIKYNVNWGFYSKKGRISELNKVIKNLDFL